MHGLKIGHFTDQERGTGASVFLFEQGAVGAYWICGSAPATHELVVLDPDNSVAQAHALVFTGGSAFGLYSALGAMQYLSEKQIGHPTLKGVVPIVPAVAIYDLAYKSSQSPTAKEVYQACLNAKDEHNAQGQMGAGTGATVGKLIPDKHHMTGGIGYATLTLPEGIEVTAYAVVNSVGDVRDKEGHIIAGACDENGEFANCEAYLLSGRAEKELFAHSHTTLVAVFTNARFSKEVLKRIAKMATAGMGRAIAPIFTRFDGDILFCFSLGELIASELTIGTMAASAVQTAIINAVKSSEVI